MAATNVIPTVVTVSPPVKPTTPMVVDENARLEKEKAALAHLDKIEAQVIKDTAGKVGVNPYIGCNQTLGPLRKDILQGNSAAVEAALGVTIEDIEIRISNLKL